MARSKSPLVTHTFPRPAHPTTRLIAGIPGLGDPERLLADRQPLAEFPPLGEAQRQPDPGEDGGQPGHVAGVVQQVAVEQLDVLAQGVHGPRVLAERMVSLTEPEVRRDAKGEVPAAARIGNAPSSRWAALMACS